MKLQIALFAWLWSLLLSFVILIQLNVLTTYVKNVEIDKVWGVENYEMYTKLIKSEPYKTQQKMQLEGALQQIAGLSNTQSWDTNNEFNIWQFSSWTLNQDQISLILKSNKMEWDKDTSKFIALEYSDLECPYCKQFYKEWTLKSFLAQFKNEFVHEFKHFPLPIHENATSAAIAASCAFEQKGIEWYNSMINSLFTTDKTLTSDLYVDISKTLWLDEKLFNDCQKDEKISTSIELSLQEWLELFKIDWTPSTVLINKETWKYVVVNGWYPLSLFNEVLDSIK